MSAPSGVQGALERPGSTQGSEALEKEARLLLTGWQQEVEQGHHYGLEAAESNVDRRISTFSHGELPHFAGINTCMKGPA
jgi:agmatinase